MSDVVLIRKTNGTYATFTGCTAVSLTGQVTAYGSITGSASGNTVTIPGSSLLVGTGVTFTTLTGGSGLTTGVKYYVVNVSGTDYKLATSQGGTFIDITTNITAGTLLIQTDELMVWSSEFRDIFTASPVTISGGLSYSAGGTAANVVAQSAVIASDVTLVPATPPVVLPYSAGYSGYISGTLTSTASDEISHNPLRQSFLARTHWKFTMSAGPSPLYATWADGDIIANNPPNT